MFRSRNQYRIPNIISIFILGMFLLSSGIWQPAQAAPAATFNITVDTGTDDPLKSACTEAANDCSLRGAISYANATDYGSEIHITIPALTFYSTHYVPNENDNQTGDWDIKGHTVYLEGAGRNLTIIDGQTMDRVIDNIGSTLTLEHLKLTQGKAPTGDSGGGGILNRGGSTLNLIDVLIENNVVEGTSQYVDIGGGVGNYGTLNIQSSVINDNHACNGGGVGSNAAWMTIDGTTISNNEARTGTTSCGDGGGLLHLMGNGPLNSLD